MVDGLQVRVSGFGLTVRVRVRVSVPVRMRSFPPRILPGGVLPRLLLLLILLFFFFFFFFFVLGDAGVRDCYDIKIIHTRYKGV